jgi:hypothetical protein
MHRVLRNENGDTEVNELLILVPSRERPQNVARLGAIARETMYGAGSLLFIFDDDDTMLEAQQKAADDNGWPYEVQENLITVPKINLAASRHLDAPFLMFLGDDHIPRTDGWDDEILASFSDLGGTGYVYPWGLGRTDTPEVCAISTDIVKALGWFGLPGINHFYVDNVWADIGNGAGCLVFRRDVILEHMHWTFGKGPLDHINHRAIVLTGQDEITYNHWRSGQMNADIEVVRRLREQKNTGDK